MSVSDQLRTEIARYLIGHKVRALRLRRSMGLSQLGERAGLSPALLSKIENNKLVPTVPTLLRIALVFDVTLDHFFQNELRQHLISITRQDDRDGYDGCRLVENDSCHLTRLDLGPGDRKFLPYLAEFFAPAETTAKPHMHQGFEFIHVLAGTLELLMGSDPKVLRPGDSIYFDSNLRHSYRRVGKDKCTALMVLAYPERTPVERRMERMEEVDAVRHVETMKGHLPLSQRMPVSGKTSYPVRNMANGG